MGQEDHKTLECGRKYSRIFAKTHLKPFMRQEWKRKKVIQIESEQWKSFGTDHEDGGLEGGQGPTTKVRHLGALDGEDRLVGGVELDGRVAPESHVDLRLGVVDKHELPLRQLLLRLLGRERRRVRRPLHHSNHVCQKNQKKKKLQTYESK